MTEDAFEDNEHKKAHIQCLTTLVVSTGRHMSIIYSTIIINTTFSHIGSSHIEQGACSCEIHNNTRILIDIL